MAVQLLLRSVYFKLQLKLFEFVIVNQQLFGFEFVIVNQQIFGFEFVIVNQQLFGLFIVEPRFVVEQPVVDFPVQLVVEFALR